VPEAKREAAACLLPIARRFLLHVRARKRGTHEAVDRLALRFTKGFRAPSPEAAQRRREGDDHPLKLTSMGPARVWTPHRDRAASKDAQRV
jgi:hypothetical protein